MKKIILFGFGGHAVSCLDIIIENNFDIIGYVDNEKKKIYSKKFYDIEHLGNDFQINEIFKKYKSFYGLVSFGSYLSLKKRSNLYNRLKALGIKFMPIISSSSYISKISRIENATIIMHKAIINIGVTIKNNCIINNGVIIDHESTINNNCIISPGVIINGQVKVGENTFIGSGAVISNNVEIGKNCIIGAGVILKKNLPNNSIIK